jgi:hypothetical protein
MQFIFIEDMCRIEARDATACSLPNAPCMHEVADSYYRKSIEEVEGSGKKLNVFLCIRVTENEMIEPQTKRLTISNSSPPAAAIRTD